MDKFNDSFKICMMSKIYNCASDNVSDPIVQNYSKLE